MNFLNNLDQDIRDALIVQMRNLWTHRTTALEGNSLTLGETAFVIGEGLMIKGTPVKDHQEVIGHAKAIDLLCDLPLMSIFMFPSPEFTRSSMAMAEWRNSLPTRRY